MDGFRRAHGPAFRAGNALPVIALGQLIISGVAFGQEAFILFVDIAGLAAGLARPVRHEPLRDGQGDVEEEDLVRCRQAHLAEFKVLEPGR